VEDHFYQPLTNPKHLRSSLRDDRPLPGVDWNVAEQLDLLSKFHYQNELLQFPHDKQDDLGYHYNTHSYLSGDSEILYNMIRHFKPKRMIEIGSGMSTLMAWAATKKNAAEGHPCEQICVEPYMQPWLEKTGLQVIRKRVEDLDLSMFDTLERGDILFIDSSHIIRPQGDVLFEFQQLIPRVKPGVIIHVHDIFSPKDYLDDWIKDKRLMWNEQYLLESFLAFNSEYRVLCALNFLTHHHRDALAAACPVFAEQKHREPGAFWMVRNG